VAKHRIDAQDTVDVATNLLHRLQSEGWALSLLEWDVAYATSEKGPKMPISAKVIIELEPIR